MAFSSILRDIMLVISLSPPLAPILIMISKGVCSYCVLSLTVLYRIMALPTLS